MADIGATLREARMRARLDVSEIEAQTKIRAKYLRALENEEWGLLPGPTFTKSFLRTYAEALGLDGRALVEEYRSHHEGPADWDRAEHVQQPLVPSPPNRASTRSHAAERDRPRGSPAHGSRAYLGLVGAVTVIIVLLLVGLLSGKGSPSSPSGHAGKKRPTAARTGSSRHRKHHRRKAPTHPAHSSEALTLALTATEPVWVCLLGPSGEQLIPGETLEPGKSVEHHATKGPFKIRIGNTALQVKVNGKEMSLGSEDEAKSYTISPAGLTPLVPGPECA